MAAIAPAVAATRSAVRTAIADLPTGAGLLVACSGGADSMALAAATAWVAPKRGHRVGLVTVDHQLQAGSGVRAQRLATWARSAGFEPVIVSTVDVNARTGGPEAAARDARYAALTAAARDHGCETVLLGHTKDDQAETVLLALVRGSGLRGLAGMPVRRVQDGVTLLRPLLGIAREQTRAACAALELPVWDDPHNREPGYRRTHARDLVATLTASLGAAVVDNLARTARLAATDAEFLDDPASA
jgi:tRNA(Ile)-lysidine synthase